MTGALVTEQILRYYSNTIDKAIIALSNYDNLALSCYVPHYFKTKLLVNVIYNTSGGVIFLITLSLYY